MSTRDTGVHEYRKYKSTGVQEYQMSGNNIIIMHMPGNIGVRCQYNMSSTGVIYHVSSIAWQVPVSYIKCQV